MSTNYNDRFAETDKFSGVYYKNRGCIILYYVNRNIEY